MEKKHTERGKNGMRGIICLIYAELILCFAPLYFEDGYFNLLQAKARVCGILTALFLTASLIAVLSGRKREDLRPFHPSFLKWSILSVAVSTLISCLHAEDLTGAFWGNKGWCVGAFAYASGAAVSLLLSRSFPSRNDVWLPVAGSNLIVFAVGILHGAGIDVFSLHREVVPDQIYQYISTIGNLNWYVGYLCLLSPIFAIFCLSAHERATKIITLLFWVPACMNFVLCASDGLFLGLGFCAFFALPYLLETEQRTVRACILLAVYGAALMTVRLCPAFSPWAEHMDGMAGQALRLSVSVPVTASAAAGAVLAHGRWDRLSRQQKAGITLLLEGLLAGAAAVLLVRSITGFNDDWGTGRGQTWRTSLELFRDFSWDRKLFGVGPELLGGYYTQLSTYFPRRILSAHSEPIQLLLTTGFAGLVSRMALWMGILAGYIRKQLWKRNEIAYFLPLAAYFAQGLVNSPQPLNEAVFWVLLGVYLQKTGKTNP